MKLFSIIFEIYAFRMSLITCMQLVWKDQSILRIPIAKIFMVFKMAYILSSNVYMCVGCLIL